jgi:GNAT superfamily N-acetyltransferase
MEIRSALTADAAALTRIAHAAKRHWGYPEAWMRLWNRDLTVSPRFIAAHRVACAIADERIVGFYALSREASIFELEHMWVGPEHMGRGVGARLFAHAVETVRALGGDRLTIASDPNAEAFYRRMGARRLGEVASIPTPRMLPLLVVDVAPDPR